MRLETVNELNKSLDGLKSTLEGLVDTQGLEYVLSSLAQVCYDKSDHVRGNRQDEELAKAWDKAGNRIDSCENAITDLELP